MQKQLVLGVMLCLLYACASAPAEQASLQSQPGRPVRLQTLRTQPYYLARNPQEVQDTCPGHDILKQFNCGKAEQPGLSCFDVYFVQGSPVPSQRYQILQETLSEQNISPQPRCPLMEPTCEAFLKAMNYNLEFSFYIANFPSSSFPECGETYDCKRLVCYFAPLPGQSASRELSCVYKRNQLFFVGSEVTCAVKK